MFTFNFDAAHYLFYSILPEFSLVILVLILILVAVTTEKEDKAYLLPLFLNLTMLGFSVVLVYLLILFNSDLYATPVTLFFCYHTLKLNQLLIGIKILLSILALGSLFNVKRYLLLYQLLGYEYPLFITLATVGMFLSVSANNWIILFLSLELQALCFLVLFAWNRRSEKALNATLKFTVINFVASTLILLAIIEIILYTQTFNMYLANPYFFLQNLLAAFFTQQQGLLDPSFLFWALQHCLLTFQSIYGLDLTTLFYANASSEGTVGDFLSTLRVFLAHPAQVLPLVLNQGGFAYQALWQFVGLLLVLGFAIKLGLIPFGLWLQDLYTCVTLPVLTFFSTAPKLTYITILLSLYLNLFTWINPEAFLMPLCVLGALSILVGNALMFTVRNNLLILLAWSSVANMGLLFLLFSQSPCGSYVFLFIIYYIFSTFFLFLLLQHFIFLDDTGTVRQLYYFTDLSVVRHHVSYKFIYMLLIFSFLNSFGIPPLLGFWMKFAALQGVVTNMETMSQWFLMITLILSTLVGGFTYLRVLYTLVTENNNLKLQLTYWPNTKYDLYYIGFGFVVLQVIGCYFYFVFAQVFSTEHLTMFTVGIMNIPKVLPKQAKDLGLGEELPNVQCRLLDSKMFLEQQLVQALFERHVNITPYTDEKKGSFNHLKLLQFGLSVTTCSGTTHCTCCTTLPVAVVLTEKPASK